MNVKSYRNGKMQQLYYFPVPKTVIKLKDFHKHLQF